MNKGLGTNYGLSRGYNHIDMGSYIIVASCDIYYYDSLKLLCGCCGIYKVGMYDCRGVVGVYGSEGDGIDGMMLLSDGGLCDGIYFRLVSIGEEMFDLGFSFAFLCSVDGLV